MNDFTDAWFIGYLASMVCGVWIGFPGAKKTLGENEIGVLAALPLWVDFMRQYFKGKPKEQFGRVPPRSPTT